ncbi:MAG: sulfur carrier protein ThiS [Bilophila sp.]
MHLSVNGTTRTCPEGLSMLELVKELGLPPEKIVVERNLSIVPADLFAKTILQDADTIEILQFVGGG